MDILNWPQDLVLLLPVRLIAFSPRANHHPLALSLAPSIGKKFAMTEMLTVLAMLPAVRIQARQSRLPVEVPSAGDHPSSAGRHASAREAALYGFVRMSALLCAAPALRTTRRCVR